MNPIDVEIADQAIETWQKEKGRIAEFLEKRRIPKLFHFTPIENLVSILENGLSPRQHLISKNIKFKSTDELRLDGLTNGTCFSLSNPNMGLLRQKRNISENKIAVLECTANTLLLYPFIAFPGNAASGTFAQDKSLNIHRYIGIEGLRNLFLNNDIRTKNRLSIHEPTDNQSEIIFLETIAVDRILTIHIPSEIDDALQGDLAGVDQTSIASDFHQPCDCTFFSSKFSFVGAGKFSFDWFPN
jgi:hypothetical protein